MRSTVVVGLVLGLVGPAYAQAPPEAPGFVATMEGGQTPLPFGRLFSTTEGVHLLVQSETAHGCGEALGHFESSGSEVYVQFTDATFTTAHEISFAGKHGGYTAAGGTVTLTRSPDQRRATGRIDVPIKDGLGGSGTFDAEWCVGPVGRWGAPDLATVPTGTVELEVDSGRQVLAYGRLFASVNGKPRLVLEDAAHRCTEPPHPLGFGIIVFFADPTFKKNRRAAVSTPDSARVTTLYAVEIVPGKGARKRRATGRVDIVSDQELDLYRARGTFDVERCLKPVKE